MSENIKKDNFILYNNMYDMLEELSNEDLGDIIKSVFRYSIFDEIPEYEKGSVRAIVFRSIKTSIDINNKKYQEKCQKNTDNARKRWNNEKILYDNQELTKGEYEELTNGKCGKDAFEKIFTNQKKLYNQGDFSSIQNLYNCKTITEDRIKEIFKCE